MRTLVSQFVLILWNLSGSRHHVSLLCSHHLLSMVYESKGELTLALQHEKEAHLIYSKLVSLKVQLQWCLCVHDLASANFNLHTQAGEDCDRTKESWKHLQSLTQQAVVLHETVNQSHSLTPDVCASLVEVCTPRFFFSNNSQLFFLCDYFSMYLFLFRVPNQSSLQSFTSSIEHVESKIGKHKIMSHVIYKDWLHGWWYDGEPSFACR